MDQTSREKNSNAEKDKELSDLNKQFELEKEKEVILQSDKWDLWLWLDSNLYSQIDKSKIHFRAALELSLKHTLADKKFEFEMFMKTQRERERDMKNLKKTELQLKAAQDSLTNFTLQYEKLLAIVSNIFFIYCLILKLKF